MIRKTTTHGRGAQRPTLRDVARAAGVSVWTASNAYGHPERVASATRERVLATAAAIGYSGPDPAARSLALGRTGIVAFVADGAAEPLLADPAAALVARGLVHACDHAGVGVLLSAGLGRAAVDGAALFRTVPDPPPPHPFVVVDAPAASGVTAVRADVGAAGAALAGHLRELGHRDIVVLAWPGAGDRLEGARRGWGDAGPMRTYTVGTPEGRAVAERTAGPTRADGEALARVALAARPRPTAILALSDVLARGVLDVAQRMGIKVPRDLSVAGIDDLEGSDAMRLTTSFVPYRPLGELAGAILSALVDGTEPAIPPPLPTVLTIRGTTGPPSRS